VIVPIEQMIEKVNRIFQEKESPEPVDPPPIMEKIESTNEIEKALKSAFDGRDH